MNFESWLPGPEPLAFTDPWEYELAFPGDPRGPGIARLTLRAVLAAHGVPELIERAELLTSELTTNSVRHTGGSASVRLRWTHPVLRVSVSDTASFLPATLRSPSPEAGSGRGLFILDRVADRWGGCALGDSLLGPGGKSIWCELAVRTGPPPPATSPALAA